MHLTNSHFSTIIIYKNSKTLNLRTIIIPLITEDGNSIIIGVSSEIFWNIISSMIKSWNIYFTKRHKYYNKILPREAPPKKISLDNALFLCKNTQVVLEKMWTWFRKYLVSIEADKLENMNSNISIFSLACSKIIQLLFL